LHVKPTRVLITDYVTSTLLFRSLIPSWERHTFFSLGGPFQTIVSYLCALALDLFKSVIFVHYLDLGFFLCHDFESSWSETSLPLVSSYLNQLPQFGLISKPPPKRCRVNKCGTYISTTHDHDNLIMSTDMSTYSGMNGSRIHLTPISI
jgi:hypothetical protein